MSDFKIEEILGQESFSTEHGQFVSYEVRFSGEQGSGVAQHKRKASSPAPKAGDVIDAEIVRKGEKTELKRVWKQNGGGSPGGGGKSSYDDPKTIARITRSHAQKMALEHAKVLHFSGKLPDGYGVESLKPIIDWFEADVLAKAAEA